MTLEFNVDRLAAAEPGLGGAWGARFLERLLATPALPGSGRRIRGGGGSSGMFGRARASPAARAAANAAAYPVDVEHR